MGRRWRASSNGGRRAKNWLRSPFAALVQDGDRRRGRQLGRIVPCSARSGRKRADPRQKTCASLSIGGVNDHRPAQVVPQLRRDAGRQAHQCHRLVIDNDLIACPRPSGPGQPCDLADPDATATSPSTAAIVLERRAPLKRARFDDDVPAVRRRSATGRSFLLVAGGRPLSDADASRVLIAQRPAGTSEWRDCWEFPRRQGSMPGPRRPSRRPGARSCAQRSVGTLENGGRTKAVWRPPLLFFFLNQPLATRNFPSPDAGLPPRAAEWAPGTRRSQREGQALKWVMPRRRWPRLLSHSAGRRVPRGWRCLPAICW